MDEINWTYLSHFIINHHLFEHQFTASNDSTRLVNDDGDLLYTVNNNAKMFDANDNHIGSFYTDKNSLWEFHVGPFVIKTGNKDLLKAEMKVFTALVSA